MVALTVHFEFYEELLTYFGSLLVNNIVLKCTGICLLSLFLLYVKASINLKVILSDYMPNISLYKCHIGFSHFEWFSRWHRTFERIYYIKCLPCYTVYTPTSAHRISK